MAETGIHGSRQQGNWQLGVPAGGSPLAGAGSEENRQLNQMRSGYREAREYLSAGGLAEVLALADAALRGGAAKVQMDTEMALVLCHLAAEGLTRIEERTQPATAQEYWDRKARSHATGPSSTGTEGDADRSKLTLDELLVGHDPSTNHGETDW